MLHCTWSILDANFASEARIGGDGVHSQQETEKTQQHVDRLPTRLRAIAPGTGMEVEGPRRHGWYAQPLLQAIPMDV